MEKVVGGKYRIGRKIGSGSFGEIYIGMIYLIRNFHFACLNIIFNFCLMFELFYDHFQVHML